MPPGPRRSAAGPRRSVTGPRRSAAGPRRSAADPRGSVTSPRRSAAGPRRSAADARRSAAGPRGSAADTLRSAAGPRLGGGSTVWPGWPGLCPVERGKPVLEHHDVVVGRGYLGRPPRPGRAERALLQWRQERPALPLSGYHHPLAGQRIPPDARLGPGGRPGFVAEVPRIADLRAARARRLIEVDDFASVSEPPAVLPDGRRHCGGCRHCGGLMHCGGVPPAPRGTRPRPGW